MPGMNGTGPIGTGPIGRGLGPCGRGRGFRRGLGRRFWRIGLDQNSYNYAYPQQIVLTKDEEKKILQDELQGLKDEIKEIETRLKELK